MWFGLRRGCARHGALLGCGLMCYVFAFMLALGTVRSMHSARVLPNPYQNVAK